MNDKELLEFAAKAASLPECGWMGPAFMYVKDNTFTDWNPLTDDGDALRLAVKLELSIQPDSDLVMVGDMYCEWEYFEDRGEATRIAITRAAAEIGKSL
jgi:hypothetical protein